MTEAFYDKEIAPKLLEIVTLCKEKGIPFLAVAEYSPRLIGRTELKTEGECTSMVMVRHCARTAPNIDGYIIGLSRWAKENSVNIDGSIVMKMLKGEGR